MSKNTTDELREQIYKIFRELGVPSADSGGMEKPYVIEAADGILALISNREKLARKKALNDMTVWANNEMAKDWVRKELDGGQSYDR
jgi:hypothetical protein